MPAALALLSSILAQWRLWALGLAAAALVAGVLYVRGLRADLDRARGQLAAASAQAVVASGQAAAVQSAAAIADQGAQRAALDITVHEENEHAIQTAQGATAPLAPALNGAGRDGLCRYDAYADDPGCVGLRGGDPAVLPQAGGGDAAAPR
jgi:hypothetical protein